MFVWTPGEKTFFVIKVFSIFIFITALFFTLDTVIFLSKAEETTGEVIGNIQKKYSPGKYSGMKKPYFIYRPVFAIRAPSGEILTMPSTFENSKAYSIGKKVILYVTFNPPEARENSSLWRKTKGLFIGALFLYVWPWFFYRHSRPRFLRNS